MAAYNVLVEVRDLRMWFLLIRGMILQRRVGYVKAVDGLTSTIRTGETLGLVGESGCGKSTTGRAILHPYSPTSGEVLFHVTDLTKLSGQVLGQMRRRMQIIFQNPYVSLNPRMTAGEIVSEPLEVHNIVQVKARQERVRELFQVVGLNPNFVERYPHEFSGGQRQRIGIARALAIEPEFIVCDEPISTLDVSIQAQIINLREDLQARFSLTYLFIAHDLAVVRHISDRVAVIYLGKIVELTDRDDARSRHRGEAAKMILSGDVPRPANPPRGCRFSTRCPAVMGIWKQVESEFTDVDTKHYVACHLYQRYCELDNLPPGGIPFQSMLVIGGKC